MKLINTSILPIKKTIYERIAWQDDITKAELMAEFSITSSSLTRLLEELTNEEWIIEAGFGESTGGRRPILYRIHATKKYIFGLDISRIYSTLGLFDLKLNAVTYKRWTMDETMTPKRLLSMVAEEMTSLMEAHGITSSQIVGIGIGAVGPIDRDRGVIVEPLYFPAEGWKQVSICAWLEEQTGISCLLANGANAGIVGEHWASRAENVQHMLYVHAGIGLRSAMLSNGELVNGAVDMEGSIGQMVIQYDGPRLHGTGNYGALEAFASVQAIEQQVRAKMKTGRIHIEELEDVDPENIHFSLLTQALRRGDANMKELFTQSATYLGIGLGNLINILHPERVILGGALITADDLVYETAVSVSQKNIYYSNEYQPIFSKGILQENAVAVGAAMLVWKQMLMKF